MLAIDPGTHSPGFAHFDVESKELTWCTHDLDEHPGAQFSTIVCEKPFIYPRSPVNPNHIITLAISAGLLVGAAKAIEPKAEVVWVLPRVWKGQIPKTKKLKNYIVYKRIVDTLNKFENKELARAIAAAPKAEFDIADAVGIGLFALKRL